MTLSSLIKEHKIYWLKNGEIRKGTYSKDWSMLIFYYMVSSGAFDFYKEKAKLIHSWGFLLSNHNFKLGLDIVEFFLKMVEIKEKDILDVIANMKSIDADNIMFVHYGFVVDYENKSVERVDCNCDYCNKPLVEENHNGESEQEIAAQLLCAGE